MVTCKSNKVLSNIEKVNNINSEINQLKKAINELEKQKKLLIENDEQYSLYLSRFMEFKDIIGSRLLDYDSFYKYFNKYKNCNVDDEDYQYLQEILLL